MLLYFSSYIYAFAFLHVEKILNSLLNKWKESSESAGSLFTGTGSEDDVEFRCVRWIRSY